MGVVYKAEETKLKRTVIIVEELWMKTNLPGLSL
jgi:hypothetical protein